MWWEVTGLMVCLVSLAWSADRFVSGAVGIAAHTRLSPLWVGTVLVGCATTLPECLVSLSAVWQGHVGLSLGNALGSYVANIGMVLGLTALWTPLPIHMGLLKRELPTLSAMYLLLVACLADCVLGYSDGWVLLTALLFFVCLLTRLVLREQKWLPKAPTMTTHSLGIALFWFVLGGGGLWLSAKGLVWSAMGIAGYWGVSDWVMGVTVVAVGTSLPELAASLASARQGHYDLALGNVIGSNIFGMLGVVALPALLAPGPIPAWVVFRDLTAMGVMTLLLWLAVLRFKKPIGRIERFEGAVLFLAFVAYLLCVLLIKN